MGFMHFVWLAGAIAPLAMIVASAVAHWTGHRWRWPITAGACAGVASCAMFWGVLRYALRGSDRYGEILFLQIALMSAGCFVFGVVAMLTHALRLKHARPAR